MQKIGLFALVVILNAVVWSEILTLAQNSLINNPNWFVHKAALMKKVSGSNESLLSRSLLSGYEMNFDQVYSFQRISSRHQEEPERIDFRFHLAPDAYFDVVYAQTTDHLLGLRLSNNELAPAITYGLTSESGFVSSNALTGGRLESGWHRASLRHVDDSINLSIDGGSENKIPGGKLLPQFQFHSGFAPVKLSHVEVFSGNHLLWEDDFTSGERRKKLLLATLLFFIVLGGVTYRWPRFMQRILVLSSLWLCFDFFYFSRVSVKERDGTTHSVFPTVSWFDFEQSRRKIFDLLLKPLNEETAFDEARLSKEGYSLHVSQASDCSSQGCRWLDEPPRYMTKKPGEQRILLLGGSFYEGSGVYNITNSFFFSIWDFFAKKSSPGTFVTAINLSAAGEWNGEQIRRFFNEYADYDPDFIFLGSNTFRDHDIEEVKRLWDYTQEKNIKLVLIKAPMNLEAASPEVLKWPLIREATTKYNIPTVVLSTVTKDPQQNQSGYLWWDEAHMTDYGNHLVGQYAAQKLWDLTH